MLHLHTSTLYTCIIRVTTILLHYVDITQSTHGIEARKIISDDITQLSVNVTVALVVQFGQANHKLKHSTSMHDDNHD